MENFISCPVKYELRQFKSEAYSELCQTSKKENFAKIFNNFTIFAKRSILDV